MGIEQLTPSRMDVIDQIAHSQDVCRPFESEGRTVWDDWCASASEPIAEYLEEQGIRAVAYEPDFETFGGVPIDRSHVWVVLMDDGTIVDATITQYLSGSPEQIATVEGYPHDDRWPDIAVVAATDPFVARMGYESHTKGRGWSDPKPEWLKQAKTAASRHKRMAAKLARGES